MLIYTIIIVLLYNSLVKRWDSTIYLQRITNITFIFSIILTYYVFYITFLEKGLSLYNNVLKITPLFFIILFFILSIVFIIVNVSSFDPFSSVKLNKKFYLSVKKVLSEYKINEYALIIMFVITGGIFLMSSNDIISIFLSIELQSYGLYLICTTYRSDENSVKAGLMYFLLGGLSSCIILLGQSILYLNTGTTNLENIYIINTVYQIIVSENNNFYSNLLENYIYIINYLQYSFILICLGLLFKISAAPFHFWSPDVYDSIPTRVTMFVSIVPKMFILTLLLQLLYYTYNNYNNIYWNNILLYSSILSLIIGSILGLTQSRIKRLFAYSTISHLGFILLALTVNNIESYQSFTFYLLQYSVSNLNAFIILISIGYILSDYFCAKDLNFNKISKDIHNSPIQLVTQLKGFFWINPTISISFIITLFSFVGMPPLIGFFGKQLVLTAALNNGYIFVSIIAIITSAISAVYYLGVVKNIFDTDIIYFLEKKHTNINHSVAFNFSLSISLITLLILSFMFYNTETLLYIL